MDLVDVVGALVVFLVFPGIARVGIAHLLRQWRVVEPRLARLAGFEFDRSKGLQVTRHSGLAARRPARLVQQRGIDEQGVAASHPMIQRGEFVIAE